MNPYIRRLGAVVAVALIAAVIGNVGASAQDSHPSTDKCTPTKFFTPKSLSTNVSSEQLCLIIVGTWKIERAEEGEIK